VSFRRVVFGESILTNRPPPPLQPSTIAGTPSGERYGIGNREGCEQHANAARKLSVKARAASMLAHEKSDKSVAAGAKWQRYCSPRLRY
jgi:hypothetical protein